MRRRMSYPSKQTQEKKKKRKEMTTYLKQNSKENHTSKANNIFNPDI